MERIIDERTFSPVVITTFDGFALPLSNPRKILLGLGMVVIAHTDGKLYQIPLRAIAHITEQGTEIG